MKASILFFIVALLPIMTWADESGSCGDNLTYYYEESSKTLTISGSGKMTNYGEEELSPWAGFNITSLVMEDGLTSIGNSAFYGCHNLTSVTIPNSVTSIGLFAFYNMNAKDKCLNLG